MSRRRLLRSIAAAALLMPAAPSLAASPRIVSMNVCTDQLLLALADPGQILGLSRFSRDARQGWVGEGARQAASGRHFRVLPLSRRGWVPGRDSFVGAILAEAGLANAAGDLGVDFGGFASLEAIVSVKPDFLVVSDAGDRAEDDGRAFLLHPALERFYPRAKRIVIPERMTECGGVLLADALNALTAELKRVGR